MDKEANKGMNQEINEEMNAEMDKELRFLDKKDLSEIIKTNPAEFGEIVQNSIVHGLRDEFTTEQAASIMTAISLSLMYKEFIELFWLKRAENGDDEIEVIDITDELESDSDTEGDDATDD